MDFKYFAKQYKWYKIMNNDDTIPEHFKYKFFSVALPFVLLFANKL